MDAVFRIERLRHGYKGRTVLDIPELSLPRGAITGITGHNGSGKSTLMAILACIKEPDEGRVLYGGRAIGPSDLAARRKITLLLQTPYLLKRSVRGNVAYGLAIRNSLSPDEAKGRVDQALDMVGLDPESFGGRSWFELSGGEAQRVAMAARLVLRPEVLLMDEPTASLDRESAERIRDAATQARTDWNTSVVVVSHDHAWLDAVCDSVVHMADGRLSG